MADARIKGAAVVMVTLRIDLSDRWGEDCTIGQLHQQASDSARRQVAGLIKDNPEIRLWGEVEVDHVIGGK